MELIDGNYYIIDLSGPTGRLVAHQPDGGFPLRKHAFRWGREQLGQANLGEGGTWEVRQYAAIFARPSNPDAFEYLAIRERLDVLGGVAGVCFESTAFASPSGHEGDLARVVVRFPTGDGLIISPRPDGTMVFDWDWPPEPRTDRLLYTGLWTPEEMPGKAMYEEEDGVGPIVGYCTHATGKPGNVRATIRLTDAGRSLHRRRGW